MRRGSRIGRPPGTGRSIPRGAGADAHSLCESNRPARADLPLHSTAFSRCPASQNRKTPVRLAHHVVRPAIQGPGIEAVAQEEVGVITYVVAQQA